MLDPSSGAMYQVWNEEDRQLIEDHDIPIVIAYNGENHFAPTKPLRGPAVDAIRRERIYESGWLLRFYLNRQVPNPLSWTDAQRQAWNNLSDALEQNLPHFQSPFRVIDKVYQGPNIPALKHRIPPPGEEQGRHPITGNRAFITHLENI